MNFIIIDQDKNAVKKTTETIKKLSFRINADLKISIFNSYNKQLLELIKNTEDLKLYIIAPVIEGKKTGIDIAKIIRKYDINSKIIFLTKHNEMFNQVHKDVRSVYHFIPKSKDFTHVLFKDILRIINSLYTKRFEYHTLHNDISLCYQSITHIIRDKEERKLIIHTDHNIHKVSMTFKEIHEFLDDRFKMSHRACIVNTDRVENYDWHNKFMLLDTGEVIPYLSKKYKDILLDNI